MKTNVNVDLMIIDAHAMAYRAYYALKGSALHNPNTSMPTHAIHGFFRMFFRLILDYEPKYCAVVWDSPAKTFRKKRYKDYKATRKPMPDDLRTQIEEIKNLCSESQFQNLEMAGYEADDIMGALAYSFNQKEKKNIFLISGDKDCYQLLNSNIFMLRSAKGVSNFTIIDKAWVQKELDIEVEQVTDYMALVGDGSDNIPGVAGIGTKSAIKLLKEHKSLEHIYANIEEISAPVQKKLIASKEDAFLSKELATIETKIKEINSLKFSTLKSPNIQDKRIKKLFQDNGYQQIANELQKNSSSSQKTSKKSQKYTLILNAKHLKEEIDQKLNKYIQKGKKKVLAIDTETTSLDPMNAEIVGISLCAKANEAIYIPIASSASLFSNVTLSWEEAYPILQELLEDKELCIIGQNIKYDYTILERLGLEMPKPYFDTMIASYVCNPISRRYNLDDMAEDLLSYTTMKYEEVAGKGSKKKTLDEVAPEEICFYACEDADICFQLYQTLSKEIKDKKLRKVFQEIEMPLIPVLLKMEQEGVEIDQSYFHKLEKKYNEKLDKLKKEIIKEVGYEFNLNSTRELQKVLFEDLNLPKGKKTKTGYSTNQSVLENLQGMHPVVDAILTHRKYRKLNSTYIENLPYLINKKTNRLHTSFNQTIASTGRLSSINPNLQNIPIREEEGRAIRRGFVPRAGNILVSLDYSQVELRIMAHFSNDKNLIEALKDREYDIHKLTASSVFDVKEEEVTVNMRSQAKTINFSIIYGVTEFGLAKSLGVDRFTAAQYIERFFQKYIGVQKFMQESIAFAQENGYVETLSGRIRQIPDINSIHRFRKEGAERTAINTPIQGTSADIIKLAMLAIHNDIEKNNMKSRMILQIHDELLFDTVIEEENTLVEIAKNRMENAMKLKVPLFVDVGKGKNWDEAH